MLTKIVITLAGKASIAGLTKTMLFATIAICSQFNSLDKECVITSGTDGVHQHGSKHYTGEALDFRTRNMRRIEKAVLVNNLNEALGPDFDVVLERTHLHVEYHPKEYSK